MSITVGIPFFNAVGTLGNAIRAVFAQTWQDWELVLLDDGSTDGSLEIARAICDPRVRVVSDGVNRGLSARLNEIVREARFGLVARMDADDLMMPERFERQVQCLADPTVAIVSSGMAMLSARNEVVGYRDGGGLGGGIRALLRGHGFAHAPLMGRTAWFARMRYDETARRVEDAELWCRAFSEGALNERCLALIDEPLYLCREEAGVSLRKVLVAHLELRGLIRTYGPGSLGVGGTARELMRSHVRCGVLRGASGLGVLPWATSVVRNRRGMTPEMVREVESAIARVLATTVPGLGC
jgi:glycosyltransferase involved in cell wall biosynthesis